MQIREATSLDRQIIAYFGSKFNDTHLKWRENPFLHILLLEDKEPIGFIAFQHIYERYELDYIYIEPGYQKKGYATLLIKKMIEDATKNKAESISLEVCGTNHGALTLYQKFGFVMAAKRDHYYGQEDGYLMIRKL